MICTRCHKPNQQQYHLEMASATVFCEKEHRASLPRPAARQISRKSQKFQRYAIPPGGSGPIDLQWVMWSETRIEGEAPF